jgi:aromatic-L-amino-acid/L-tryptophan decarboxylase
MLERLQTLETLSRGLDPGEAGRAELWETTRTYVEEYLRALPEAPAYTTRGSSVPCLAEAPIRENGQSLSRILGILDRDVDNLGANCASGRHMAFIPPSSMFASALADLLAAVSNRYVAYHWASPGGARMENQVLSWMAAELGFPVGTSGNLASGGSMAHLVGICAAREAAGLKARDTERACVYLSDQVHHCIEKALRVAGLGEAQVRSVPSDADYRMRADLLEAAIREDERQGLKPWLLVPTAGTTNTGAVDPLDACADLAARHGMWMHTDGAYGAFFALTEPGRAALKGLERSDSLVLDPHKGLFTPLGLGAVLVKQLEPLRRAHAFQAEYLPEPPEDLADLSPSETTLEFSKHARALRLWLPLQLYGVAPFRAALEEKLLLSRHAYDQLRDLPGLELGPEPQLSVFPFRLRPESGDVDARNLALVEELGREGRFLLTGTRLRGEFWLRLALLSSRTHRAEVDEVVARIRQAAAAVG